MKKQILTMAAAASLLLWGSAPARATLQLTLSDGNPADTVTITDNGAGDVIVPYSSTAGAIKYSGPVGNWSVTVVGTSKPIVGSASAPFLDINLKSATSPTRGALDIQLSDTDFTGSPPVTFNAAIGGNTTGTVGFDTYVDNNNKTFAETTLLNSYGPSSTTAFSGNAGPANYSGGSPYSLTLDTIIVDGANGNSGFDANLSGLYPPTANCVTINAVQGVAITPVTLVASGGCDTNYTFTATGLPAGLTMSTNGMISGTPTVSGTNSYTVTITDGCGNTGTNYCSVMVPKVPPPCQTSVCGYVFVDCDGDGFLTPGLDFGMSNVVVILKNSQNVAVATNKTDLNGQYCFYNLTAGNYTVCITQPANNVQSGGTHCNHWLNNSYQQCWLENDGYQHWKGGDGVDCWKAKDGYQHWKDSNNQDCWKDKYGWSHSQNCTYVSCDVPKGNCETFTLAACQALTNVSFAYQGILVKPVVCVTGPSKGICGKTGTYTCYVTNTGTACIPTCQVTVCGKSYNCPSLIPGQGCSFTFNYQFQYSDYGYFNCKATATCTYSGNSNNSNNWGSWNNWGSNWGSWGSWGNSYSSNSGSSCTAQGSCYTSVSYK